MSETVILIDAAQISRILKTTGLDGLSTLIKNADKVFISDDFVDEVVRGGISPSNRVIFNNWRDDLEANGKVATVSPIITDAEKAIYDPAGKRFESSNPVLPPYN